jgi:hypothetical protein
MGGNVEGQSHTFAPSLPEFMHEARKIQEALPLRDKPRLAPPPPAETFSEGHKGKMLFKMALWRYSMDKKGGLDRFAEANKLGMDEVMALAQEWNFPIPEEMWHLSPAEMKPVRMKGPPPPYEVKRQRALERFAGREVLHTDIGFDQFKSLSKAGELPVGATWSAALGTIYAKAS